MWTFAFILGSLLHRHWGCFRKLTLTLFRVAQALQKQKNAPGAIWETFHERHPRKCGETWSVYAWGSSGDKILMLFVFHSAKATGHVKHEKLDSSRRQCTLSTRSPHSWVSNQSQHCTPTKLTLFARFSTCGPPSLFQAGNAAQTPRFRVNRKRSSNRLQKTNSKLDSKSGRKAGTGIILNKGMMLNLM